jgi:hypothetical protein
MSQSSDPKDPAAPTASSAPPASGPTPAASDPDELSDEELGQVSGGIASIPGGTRPSIKSDLM